MSVEEYRDYAPDNLAQDLILNSYEIVKAKYSKVKNSLYCQIFEEAEQQAAARERGVKIVPLCSYAKHLMCGKELA